jgi:hypothetical protein
MQGDIINIDQTAFDFGSNMESEGPGFVRKLSHQNTKKLPMSQITRMLDFSRQNNPAIGEPSSSQSKYNELNNYASQKDANFNPEISLFNGRGILDINYSSPANVDHQTLNSGQMFNDTGEDSKLQVLHIEKHDKFKKPQKRAKKSVQNFHSQLTFRDESANDAHPSKDGFYVSGTSNTAKGYYSTQTGFSKLDAPLKPKNVKTQSRSTSKSKSKNRNFNKLKHFEVIRRLIGGIPTGQVRTKGTRYDKSIAEKLREHLLAKTSSLENQHFDKSYRTPEISKQGTFAFSNHPHIVEKRRNTSRPHPSHQPIPIRNSGKKPKKRHLKCTLNSVEEITSRLRTRSTM